MANAILTPEEELALRKPIDDHVGAIQAKIDALRVDGSGQFALLGPVGFDPAGAARGAVAVARIGLLVGFALTVSASTTPTALADACTRLLWPLKRLGLPSAEIGMTVSVALRFVPLVSEELERIRLAQRSRGARFDEGGVLARVRAWASVVTPLAVSLFRRADALGESMESRCFGAADQSALAPLALAARDHAPHLLCYYLKDLAAAVHAFYNAERVLVEDQEKRLDRFALLAAARQVLRNGLTLLGVSAPEFMTRKDENGLEAQ